MKNCFKSLAVMETQAKSTKHSAVSTDRVAVINSPVTKEMLVRDIGTLTLLVGMEINTAIKVGA